MQKTGRNCINDISFQNTEVGREYEEDKQSRLDLLARTNEKEWINVEIQFTNKYDMIKRSIYYWAGVYRTPMKKKMSYRELRPVIAINILNFSLIKQTERFHTIYHLYENEEKFLLTDVMEFHFIEMTKLIRDWQEEKLKPKDDLLIRWLLMLSMVDHRNGKVYDDILKELEEIALKDETLQNAFEHWEILSSTQEEVLAYEARLKRVLDEESIQREAELRAKEAEEKGKEVGMQAGREAGRQEEREAFVRKLAAKGMDVETIVELTELEEDFVQRIIKELP